MRSSISSKHHSFQLSDLNSECNKGAASLGKCDSNVLYARVTSTFNASTLCFRSPQLETAERNWNLRK